MESLHSIILCTRDRNLHLEWCLQSIRQSARLCGNDPWEVIVVDGGSEVVPLEQENVHVIQTHSDTPFNKSRLLNIGIDNALGDLITFLDADAIVGLGFMNAARDELAKDPYITKVAYRVRYVPEEGRKGESCADPQWDSCETAFEGYEQPHKPRPRHTSRILSPVFGNSQQSILRNVLGDIRYDEEYVGRGFEDLDFNAHLWSRYGPTYRAAIVKDEIRAMYHVKNGSFDGHWGSRHYNLENRRRYMKKWSQLWKLPKDYAKRIR